MVVSMRTRADLNGAVDESLGGGRRMAIRLDDNGHLVGNIVGVLRPAMIHNFRISA